MPVLIQNYKEQVLIAQIKKTYSSISQAFSNIQAAYETPGDNLPFFEDGNFEIEKINQMFAKYFNGSVYCDYTCRQKLKYSYHSNSPTGNKDGVLSKFTFEPYIILNTGAYLSVTDFWYKCIDNKASGNNVNENGLTNPDSQWTQIRNSCGSVHFDVNGSKKPNIVGLDIYVVNVYRSIVKPESYWNLTGGHVSLQNVLKGVKKPFVYTEYGDDYYDSKK